VTVAHWDELEFHRSAKGEMDAEWQWLGHAAGTKGVGVNRVRVAPGKLPTPPHSHGASEELFFVLAGSGLAWQDGNVHEVRPLDCIIHRPDGMEHTFVAGPAAAFPRRPDRLAVGRGPRRRPLGHRGDRRAARCGRAGAEAREHRQRRRGRV
jgi:quercetin dioxygenase-like cupin family protein